MPQIVRTMSEIARARKLAADMDLAHVRGPVSHGFANEAHKPCPWTSTKEGKPSPWLWRTQGALPSPDSCERWANFAPPSPPKRPKREDVEPLMVLDSQIDLMNLAPGHPWMCTSHPHGCGGLMSHFHAPNCTNNERNCPCAQTCRRHGFGPR